MLSAHFPWSADFTDVLFIFNHFQHFTGAYFRPKCSKKILFFFAAEQSRARSEVSGCFSFLACKTKTGKSYFNNLQLSQNSFFFCQINSVDSFSSDTRLFYSHVFSSSNGSRNYKKKSSMRVDSQILLFFFFPLWFSCSASSAGQEG